MLSSKLYALLAILGLTTQAYALPSHLYAGKSGALLLDPGTHAVIATLPAGAEVLDPQMLNSSGQVYTPGRGEAPYPETGGKVFVGTRYGDKLAMVELNSLTSQGPLQNGFRTPMITDATPVASTDGDPLLKMVTFFHQKTCETLRPKTPQPVDLEIAALNLEWQTFISQQKTQEAKDLASRARELDMVSRTVVFEAHGLGGLDGVPAQSCKESGSCPISSCERDVIALSIRNRGLSPSCASGHSILGCRFPGDFEGAATKPEQFSIWLPNYTHPFIASCFLKDGLETGHYLGIPANEEANYKDRLLDFKLALKSVAKVLYAPNLEPLFTYQELTGDSLVSSPDIQHLMHYYMPEAMEGCLKDHMHDTYNSGINYIERETSHGRDYALLFDQKIVPDPADFASSAAEVRFKLRVRHSNTNIQLEDFENDPNWKISRADLSLVSTRNTCATMGLPHQCPSFQNPHDYLVPFWALESGAKNAVVGCKAPSAKEVEIGGSCDLRIQLLSGVN